MADMAIVIVNHNTREQLAECLDTIRDDARSDVIVVDNASSDGSVEMLRSRFPWVTLIANETNSGYGAGANKGIARSQHKYVLVLNSDTRLKPDAFESLSRYLDDHPQVGIVGPRLINEDGSLQVSSYHSPTPAFVFLEESGMSRWIRRVPVLRNHYLRTWSHNRARSVPWVLGAALAIRRTAFDEMGGFDESFFMYYEEADLCLRLRAGGWQIHFAPVTTITHVGGASSGQRRADMLVQLYTSIRQFYRLHYSQFQLNMLNLVVKFIMLGRLTRDSARLRFSEDHTAEARRLEDIKGWRRVLSGEQATPPSSNDSPVSTNQTIDRPRATLREADWRFLLPTPPSGIFDRVVVLGGSPDLGDRLVEAGIARDVVTEIPSGRSADALAILDGRLSPERLREAISSLVPGGAMYCVIDRRRFPSSLTATPATAQRFLQSLSLTPTGVYWIAPNPALPTKFVPLDANGAMEWYLATMCMAGTPLQRLLQCGLGMLASVRSRWLTSVVPWYAITAVAGPATAVKPSILANVEIVAGRKSSSLKPILFTSAQDDASRVVMLPFMNGSREPECVFKIARIPEFNVNIENEQRILAEVRANLEPRLRNSVPQPMGLTYHGQLAAGTESLAPGKSLFVSSGQQGASRREKINDLYLATWWLTNFNQQMQVSSPQSGAERLASHAEEIFARYVKNFDATKNERQLLDEVLRRIHALRSCPLPIVRQHNDFGLVNVYRSDGALTVIDWELGWGPGFDQTGPALSDLLYFVTHWSFAAHQQHSDADAIKGLHQLFIVRDRGDDLIAAVHNAIDEYVSALRIDKRFIPLVLIYMWAERAVNRFDRRARLGNRNDDPRHNDRFSSFVSHLSNHSGQLLAMADARPRVDLEAHRYARDPHYDNAFETYLKILS
jgi:GT2 family glycosyltransferase